MVKKYEKIKYIIKKIKVIFIDIDGVLSDGVMIYSEAGYEMKNFHVRDGVGIRLAQEAGLRIVFITAEQLQLIKNRAKKLNVKDLYMGVKNKVRFIKEFVDKNSLVMEEIAFIGDDINDIPALETVGLPIAVGDSVNEAKEIVNKRNGIITENLGGKGAVREAVEIILKAKGIWEKVLEEDINAHKSAGF
ncbi:HAD hydrolase family protein [Candidatus Pacearchaeota archaeon]|nr:HAD hydrolase family protein [Candidatus Pacearchaeota archaeon]